MKQVLQNLRDGKTVVAEVPMPQPRAGMALVKTAVSLVSAGTERMVVEFAEKNLLNKARSRPDLVRQMMEKAHREGLITALEAAFNRLDQPLALGYSSAGTILSPGIGLSGFKVGDRVACAGGGYAVHAEFAVVPQNLLAPLPPNVDFESAAFSTLGAIALHGFRLAQPQLGERVAIIGLGLLGLLAAGIANAAGCSVLGIDLDPKRVALARQFHSEAVLRSDAEDAAISFTHGGGFDIVLICADSKSDDPIELAGILARDRAHVVAVGAVGMHLPRKLYYEKEIHFQVSRSYGPGRYDPKYEEKGQDYPLGYIRWTEGRNLAAFVDLLANEKLDLHPLITHRFPIDQAAQAYDLITGKLKESYLGVLLTYPQAQENIQSTHVSFNEISSSPTQPSLGVLGAGNYANAVFLPIIQKTGAVNKIGIASASGISARHAAQRYGFTYASSSDQEIIEDEKINTIVILTRHHQHARQVLAALKQGKNVYCEKPLAIQPNELDEITAELQGLKTPLLMVGFNRRFAPFALKLQQFFKDRREPFVAHYRVNAGYLPLNHWLHDSNQGGGRLVGEGCHFVDFLTFLAGSPPVSVNIETLPDNGHYHQDNLVLILGFSDGSLGTLTYLANGDKSLSKEYLEVFGAGRIGLLNDFRQLELIKDGHRSVFRSPLRQDKGHRAAWQAFLNAVQTSGPPPIPYDHLIGVMRATFAAQEALVSNPGNTIAVS